MTSRTRPLFSIITPTFERAELLERTLRSVRAQTYDAVEHIVIDGGSTDRTVDLLQRYARTYPLRWISEPDRGMYDAVNKGLRLATGTILAYLNSDDLYFPWTLATVQEALGHQPEADLVYGDVLRDDLARNILVPVFQGSFAPGRIAAFGSLLQPTVFMRRHVYERIGEFDDTLRYVADLDYWLRASRHFTFHRIPEVLALELFHKETLSNRMREEMGREDRAMRQRHRSGLWATRAGRRFAMVEWYLRAGTRWIEFVRAAEADGGGWDRAMAGLGPQVPFGDAIRGLLPSRGSVRRSGVKWAIDPRDVAMGVEPQL